MSAQQIITHHLDIWTAAHKTRSGVGRGSSNKLDLYGIKKLRELILELAVRGKLVPQDPNDAPASELLKKIAAEKEKLIKEGRIKKEKPLPETTDDEKPFELPSGWELARLSDVAYSQAGFAFKSSGFNEAGSGLPLIRIRDVGQDFSGTFFDGDFREEFVVSNGDYLISMDGNFRVAKWLGENALLNQRVSRLIFMGEFVVPAFIAESLQARLLELQGVKAYTTVDHLSGGQISESIIGVPPLAEQHRIVAKVDELMAFCDQLEQTQSNNISVHSQLVEALLTTLTNSSNHNELQNNWQRIAAHFDTLFTTEHSIDQLKQTILQLAVMGKLVPQNPNDEPASVLLKKIATEKAQLIKEGKIKKEKPLPEITDEEKPFELPSGWEWERFENLVNIQSGITKGRNLTGREVINVPYLSVANVQRGFLELQSVKQVEIGVDECDKYAVLKRDLLITEGGDWDKVGRTAIWRGEFPYMAHQNHVFKARVIVLEQNELWLEQYLNSSFAREYFAGSSKQTTNLASINKTQLRGCLIAVPPLSEQCRIVTKVYELMALCDTLTTNLQNAQTTQLALADALLESVIGVSHSSPAPVKNEELSMEIKTSLGLNPKVKLKTDAVLATIISAEDGSIDAKRLWQKSKMDLPNFYKQLKREISAGYILKPALAEIQ